MDYFGFLQTFEETFESEITFRLLRAQRERGGLFLVPIWRPPILLV
jgi:hypothetical protein